MALSRCREGGEARKICCSSALHADMIVQLAVRLREIAHSEGDDHKVDKAVSYQRSSDANKLSN